MPLSESDGRKQMLPMPIRECVLMCNSLWFVMLVSVSVCLYLFAWLRILFQSRLRVVVFMCQRMPVFGCFQLLRVVFVAWRFLYL